MSVRAEEFREWMSARHPYNTVSNYLSNVRTLDGLLDGLDELLASVGPQAAMTRLDGLISAGNVTYGSDRKSALRKYAEFANDPEPGATAGAPDGESSTDAQSYLFRFEREMQGAVRRQLQELEAGLEAIDGGQEKAVATGKIDILARDSHGKLVVIELKAGPCPSSALEQVLGYATDVEREHGEDVRAFLVASSFSERTRAAARRVSGLELHAYSYALSFDKVVN